MPLGEVLMEVVGEVFAQGFVEGVAGLVRRLGALVTSMVSRKLTYREARKRSGNGRVGLVTLVVIALLVALLG
jgi:hypothetical protein